MASERDKATENPYEPPRFASAAILQKHTAVSRIGRLLGFLLYYCGILGAHFFWLLGTIWGLFQTVYQVNRFNQAPIASVVSLAMALIVSSAFIALGFRGLREFRSQSA